MTLIQTTRLRLRELTLDDAAFIRELVNEPAWLRFIGQKNVNTLDDARRYIANGPAASYERNGFGLYCVELASSSTPIGICGLIRRDALSDVDLGFALLARYCGQGHAREAATAVLAFARRELGLQRILAITLPDNRNSIRVLVSVGFAFECSVILPGETDELSLYASGSNGLPRDAQSSPSLD